MKKLYYYEIGQIYIHYFIVSDKPMKTFQNNETEFTLERTKEDYDKWLAEEAERLDMRKKEYGSCHRFEKDGVMVCYSTGYNQFYGDVLRRWQIGDKQRTDVKMCGSLGEPLLMDSANNLIGERAFEKNSILYEYLCKPLGLSWLEENNPAIYIPYPIKEELIAKGWKEVKGV